MEDWVTPFLPNGIFILVAEHLDKLFQFLHVEKMLGVLCTYYTHLYEALIKK